MLSSVFGSGADESITNRIRICNLKLRLGKVNEALSDLLSLKGELSNLHDLGWQPKMLADRALASALSVVGREADALDLMRAMRNELVPAFGEDDTRVIGADQSISEILTRLDRTEEALEIASHVFRWRYGNVGIDDTQTLRSLWQLAYLYIDNARFDTARVILNFLLRKITSNPDHFSREFYLEALSLDANLDSTQGDLLSARAKWQAAYSGTLKIYGAESVDAQIAAANLADAFRKTGEVAAGCKLLEETQSSILATRPKDVWALEFARIAYQSCLLDEDSPADADKILRSLQASWNVISAHDDPTSRDALSALGSYANAAVRLGHHTAAKRLLSQFVGLVEAARRTASYGSITRMAAFSSWILASANAANPIAGYRQLALMHAQDVELERALRVSELARDRTLRDRFAEQDWRRTRLPEDARRRLDELLDRIQDLDERIAVEPEIVERIRLESERTLAVAERGRLERELREQLHIGEPASDPPTLDELRAHLAADTALVSVLHSGDAWWALVISRDDPARFVEFHDPDLGRNATAWVRRLRGDPVRAWPLAGNRLALDDARPDGAIGPYLTPEQLAQRLSHVLLSPLARAVGKARHLVFVGDDELVGIPLQALPFESGLALDRFELSYAPSLTTYARWQGPARPKAHSRDLLAIGAIDHPRLAPPATDDPIVVGVQYAAEHPLPFAREEIDAIAAQFPAHRANAWTGSQANKASLRRASRAGDLLRYRYVHFATHAWAQPDQPESSAIVLAGGNGDLPTQRALTAAELAGLHMGSELIVLSACDTGVGHFEHGRGLLGLAYAGLAAGNRAALLSLWPIADDTTALFMKRLYAKLRRGINPVTALAATQREFRRSGDSRLSDPLVWAPFVLYGGY